MEGDLDHEWLMISIGPIISTIPELDPDDAELDPDDFEDPDPELD